MKIRKTIAGRRKLSKFLQLANPGYSYCECCGTPWNFVKGKALIYEYGCSYFPICELCFYDESVTFNDLLIYYKREDEHPHSEAQYERIKESLMEEVELNEIIKAKYDNHLRFLRQEKIDSVIC